MNAIKCSLFIFGTWENCSEVVKILAAPSNGQYRVNHCNDLDILYVYFIGIVLEGIIGKT